MILLAALAVSVLFAAGIYLVLQPDAIRGIAGLLLLSNAAILFLVVAGAGTGRRRAPVHPVEDAAAAADPLPQALALTAIVIGFATTAFLVALVHRLQRAHDSVDAQDLARAEEEELEREPRPEEGE